MADPAGPATPGSFGGDLFRGFLQKKGWLPGGGTSAASSSSSSVSVNPAITVITGGGAAYPSTGGSAVASPSARAETTPGMWAGDYGYGRPTQLMDIDTPAASFGSGSVIEDVLEGDLLGIPMIVWLAAGGFAAFYFAGGGK